MLRYEAFSVAYRISMILSVVSVGCLFSKRCLKKFNCSYCYEMLVNVRWNKSKSYLQLVQRTVFCIQDKLLVLNAISILLSLNNSFIIIEKLNKQIINKTSNKTQNNSQTTQSNKKWVTFEYHSPIIRKVTNIFRNTNLRITYQVRNTTHN
jgi:hypothetical protein